MKKRIMAFFMALSLLVSMVPMDTLAAAGDREDAEISALTEVSVPEIGKEYVIVASCTVNETIYTSALTTEFDEVGYWNADGSDHYTGLKGKAFSMTMPVTEDMVWSFTEGGTGFYIMNGENYLNGTYEKNATSGNAAGLKVDDTKDVWTVSENILTSGNAVKAIKFGYVEENAFNNLFSVSETGSEITFYEYTPVATECQHVFAITWSKDDTNHWYACTNPDCEEKSEVGTHKYEDGECIYCEYKSPGHVLLKVSAKAATCTEPGNIDYYECTRCGDLFEDAQATIEITDSNSVVVQATDHHFGDWTVIKEATCTETGIKEHACTNEGCNYVNSQDIPIKNHNWEEQATVDVEATCYQEGSSSIHCADCDATKDVTVIEKTAHKFTDYKSNNDATCTEDGTKTASCDNEGCTEEKTITDEGTKGHKFGTKWIMDSEEHWNECTVCSAKGNRASHKFEKDQCTVCEFIREHVHELKLVPAVAAGCETDGNIAYYVCEGCEEWFEDEEATKEITDRSTVVTEKTGHKFGEHVSDDNATCTEDGTKTAKCENCTKTDTIADPGSTRGHSFTKYVSDNNGKCEEDGTKTAKCDRCSQTNTVTDENSATGHIYTIWHVVKPATCTEDGLQERECTVCEKEAEEVIPAKGHAWDTKTTVDVAPTCTEKGSESIHCLACDVTKDAKPIDELGHSFTDYKENKDASCTTDGTMTAICDRCDQTHTKVEEGSALGHRYAAAWSKGADAHWHECIDCGDKKDVKEHTFKKDTCTICEYERNHVHQTVLVAAKDAKCEATGNTSYYACEGCEDWFEDAKATKVITDKTKIVVAKLGHDKVAPTCTEPTTCSRCDYTEGKALGHEFKNYVSDNNAECEKDATKTATCTRCTEKDTIAEPGTATGHSYDENKVCTGCNQKKPFVKVELTEKAGTKTYTGKEIAVSEDIIKVEDTVEGAYLKYYVDKACEIPTYDGLENAGDAPVKTGIYYVKAVVAEDDVYDETISDDTYVLKIIPKRVSGFKAENSSSSIKLTWKKSSEASGYRIYRRDYGTSSSDYELIATITSSKTVSYLDKDIKQGKHYYYTIAAYKNANDGEETVKVAGSKLKTAAQIIRVKVKSIVNNNGSVKITWNEIAKADTYEVWRKVYGQDEEYKLIKTITSGATSYTDKASKMLVNGRLSYYYVVAKYDTKSNVVVQSDTKKNYYMKRPSISGVSVKTTSATVKWNKNSSATGYEVMYSTSSSFENAKKVIISDKDTVSKKITGLKKGKKYYVKVRAYKLKNEVSYDSAWSGYKSFTISK